MTRSSPPGRIATIARTELRLTASDPLVLVTLTLMPFVLMAFLRNVFGAWLRFHGYPSASGAESEGPGPGQTVDRPIQRLGGTPGQRLGKTFPAARKRPPGPLIFASS